MRSKPLVLAFVFTFAATLPLLLAACSTNTTDDDTGAPSPSTAPTSPLPPRILDTTASRDAVGTTVRFTAGDTSIHVTMADNPAAQDFLSMLPLTLEFEDFAGNEKISYLPRELDHEETEGSILNQGDFLYYIPWGNVGFWYPNPAPTPTTPSYSAATQPASTTSNTSKDATSPWKPSRERPGDPSPRSHVRQAQRDASG